MNSLESYMAEHGPIVTRRAVRELGLHDQHLTTAIRDGILVRPRSGVYIDAKTWEASDKDTHYRLTVQAVLSQRRGDRAARVAAFAMHGLPVYRYNYAHIDTYTPSPVPYRGKGLTARPLATLDELPACTVAATPIGMAFAETAANGWLETACVAANHALHTGAVTMGECADAVHQLRRGKDSARKALAFLNAKIESPGETLTYMALVGHGLRVAPQVAIHDVEGELIGRVDFVVTVPWSRDRVIVEFDGGVKYSGDGAGEAIMAEKRRQSRLEAQGYLVARFTWDDLKNPDDLALRVRNRFRSSGAA